MINKKKNNLLLLHGWGFNSSIWETNLAYLNTKFNISTLDLNGHGNQQYNPEHEDIDRYLDYLIKDMPKNSDIVGWSLGGIIALRLKHKYPDIINNLTLCCSNPCFINNQSWTYGVEQETWNKFSINLFTNKERAIKDFLLLQTMSSPKAKTLYEQLTKTNQASNLPDINGLNWGLNILKQDYRDLLAQINHKKIKFIFGARDLLINKDIISWFSETHPTIKAFILKNSGHIPFITEPDLFYHYLTEE